MIARILLSLGLVLALPACGDDDSNAGQDGSTDQDAMTQMDADTQMDAAVALENWIGDPCTCTGAECEEMGVPKPNTGTIAGCENVPSQTGGELVCLRSYGGTMATVTYFANGFCSLMATTCTGDSMICDSAVFGDFANMTACPAGSAMIQDSQDVDVFGFTATIENKTCAPGCDTNADCRVGEEDPVYNHDPTEYQCVDKDGVKFCYDPRNLGDTYTATAF